MAERIKRLYEAGRLNADGVKAAWQKGLITEEEYRSILASKAEVKAEGEENAD